MKKKNIKKIISIVSVFILALVFSFAIYGYVKSNTNNSKIIRVYLDTKGKEINVVEGGFMIEPEVKILSINTSQSAFSIWAEKPVVINKNEVNFVGGIEGGIYGKDIRVFDVTVLPFKSDENLKLKVKNIYFYLNDGKGTRVNTSENILSLKYLNNDKKDSSYKILLAVFIAVFLFTLINVIQKLFIKNK